MTIPPDRAILHLVGEPSTAPGDSYPEGFFCEPEDGLTAAARQNVGRVAAVVPLLRGMGPVEILRTAGRYHVPECFVVPLYEGRIKGREIVYVGGEQVRCWCGRTQLILGTGLAASMRPSTEGEDGPVVARHIRVRCHRCESRLTISFQLGRAA